MRNFLSLSYIVIVASLSGCAVGPLVSHETARTVGKSNHEIVGGYGIAGHVIKWNYGATEDIDVGLHWETLSIGVRVKYAFQNNKNGWSWAGAVGLGDSLGGNHYYADLIGSYLAEAWEPYGTLRIVHVTTDPADFRDKNTGEVAFRVSSTQFDYGQAILGTRYWITPHWLFSIEASTLFSMSSNLTVDDSVLVGLAFGYRF